MSLEIVSFRRKKDGGWQAVRVDGIAEKNDKGDLNITLFTIPAATDGAIRLVVKRREERDGGGYQRAAPPSQPPASNYASPPSSEIPF